MSENTYCVYKHTTPSGKVYIGKTKFADPRIRWKSGKGYGTNPYFTHAIEKYGWQNIKHEILAKNLTEEEAYWDEIFFIEMFDSFDRERGYNLTRGGDGSLGVPMTEEHKEKVRKGSREKNKGRFVGEKSSRARGCNQYDLDGFFIKHWGSISDASRAMEVHFSSIVRACSGEEKTSAGYLWTYDDEDYLLPYKVREMHRHRHWQTIDGVRVCHFTYD